jgi:hypothetical protein
MPLSGVCVAYCNQYLYNQTTPSVPYITTDENGFFHTDNMHCRTFHLQFTCGGEVWGDTVVDVEPDSLNYHEYCLEGVYGKMTERINDRSYQILNYPNPVSTSTRFIVEGTTDEKNGSIRIYNSGNALVQEVFIELGHGKNELRLILDDKFVSGPYFYLLEIDNFTVATGKMIVVR